MDKDVLLNLLNERDAHLVARIRRVIPLLADLSRADVLIGVPSDNQHIQIIAHARPHSIAPVHRESLEGQTLTRTDAAALFRAIEARQYARGQREYPPSGTAEGTPAPTVQEAYPIENEAGQVIGGMLIETNLLESERLKRRSEVFQRVLKMFQRNALRGEPAGIEHLTSFGEHDGIVVVDAEGIIRYMSGIATNLYRTLGYGEQLVGKPLSYLETQDDELVRQALATRRCRQAEHTESGRHWIKKVIPVVRTERSALLPSKRTAPLWAFLLVHDDTEARQRARELMVKTTMIKEVHHRVKNDLQTVASLLRMQARRLKTDEAKAALAEAVNRVLSVAVIHEFLSAQDTRAINLRDVAQRIVHQMQAGLLDPNRQISFAVRGPNIYLPARQATSCALIINELLQNALEHGFDLRESDKTARGAIELTFEDHGDAVGLIVHDDGRALPPDFSLDRVDSLGLRIVQMLVTQDLKGQIDLQSDHGVSAIVRFPKMALGGEEKWNEPE
jgi:two-component sensor histidine kinase/PAS domain-containing protein